MFPCFYGWGFLNMICTSRNWDIAEESICIKGLQEGVNRAKKRLVNGEVIKVEAHPIPTSKTRRVVGRMALVGDAAGYVQRFWRRHCFAQKWKNVCRRNCRLKKMVKRFPENELKNYLKVG